MSLIRKVNLFLDNLSSHSLIACVLAIFLLSLFNLSLRLFQVNLQWIDPLVRHLAILCLFLGGVVATGRGDHFRINLINKIWITRFVMFISCCVLLWFMKAGIDFTVLEMEFTKDVGLGFLKSGHLVSIIPIGSAIIALRFFLLLLLSFEGSSV